VFHFQKTMSVQFSSYVASTVRAKQERYLAHVFEHVALASGCVSKCSDKSFREP